MAPASAMSSTPATSEYTKLADDAPPESLLERLNAVIESARRGCKAWTAQLARVPRLSSTRQFSESVPIVGRDDLFATKPWDELVRGGDLRDIEFALLSSGTTGAGRAVGMLDRATYAKEAGRLRAALTDLWPCEGRSLLVLNTLPDGQAPPWRPDDGTLLNTGGSVENGSNFVAQLGACAEHIIVIGEPDAVLAQLEHSAVLLRSGMPRMHVLVGGCLLQESAREQMCRLLGADPDRDHDRVPLSSFGMAEVGMHLLWETPATVALRRVCMSKPQLSRAVGLDDATRGSLMTYDPDYLHVEVIAGELVLTRLDATHIQPMIRYNTHDRGRVLEHHVARVALAEVDTRLAGELPTRLVWVAGRCRGGGHDR